MQDTAKLSTHKLLRLKQRRPLDERRAEIFELSQDMIVRSRLSILVLSRQALLIFVLATVPLLFGAVQAWVWPIYTVVVYAAFAGLVLNGKGPEIGAGDRLSSIRWWAAPGVFLIMTLIACVPLPEVLLSNLSPVRFELLQQAAALNGREPAWAAMSYAPLQSFAWWAFLLSLVLLFIVCCVHFGSRSFSDIVLWVLFYLAVLEAVYGILQAMVPNLGVLWVSYLKAGMGNARGTYINRNHFAGFIEMLLPLLVGFSLSRVRWHGRVNLKALLQSEHLHQHVLMILGLVLMALALLFSKSRAGITGAVVGFFLFFVFLCGGARHMPKGVWVACALFFGLTLMYGFRIGFEPIIVRFLEVGPENSRIGFWRDSLTIIAAHPLGIGLAAFKSVFPIFDVSSLSDATMPVYLHNDVLQLLVESGWIGFIALAGALVAFMVVNFKRIRRMDAARYPRRFFLAAGAYSGLAAMVFHSFLDFNMQIPANAVYFVMSMAIVRVMAYRGEVLTESTKRSLARAEHD